MKVTKGAAGPSSTASVIRQHLKNSNAVNHAVLYPPMKKMKNPTGGNKAVESPQAERKEVIAGEQT